MIATHEHLYEWLEIDWQQYAWVCRCGKIMDDADWESATAQGRRTAEALGTPPVSLCGNLRHPSGAWHPKSPGAKGLWAKFVQSCRMRSWGCGCRS